MRDLATSRARPEKGDAPDLSPLKAGPLKNLSDRALAATCRLFLAYGYSVADLQFAVDHRFSGEPWRLSLRTVRRPAGWLRYRYSFWLGGDGRPLPSRSQQLEASAPPLPAGWQRMRPLPPRERQVADAVRRGWRATNSQSICSPADPAPHAAAIRARLGWATPRHVQDQLDLGLSP